MIERYCCPFCRHINNVELAQLLDEGETDIRGKIKDHQKLKLDLPARLILACAGCGREYVIVPSGTEPDDIHA